MRYRESREQSAELLRMILPLMTRQTAGFHPVSYTVWYEYVAGADLQLRAAVDTLLARGKPLDDVDIERLFEDHIAVRELAASAQISGQIRQLVAQVNDATTEAGQEVQHFGTGLTGFEQQLQTQADPRALTGAVRVMIDDTNRVRGKTELFQRHLQRSSQEVVRLREELEVVQGLALTDPLTGLFNRRGFDQEVHRQFCVNGLHNCSVLIADIDHFKAINDAHGHLLGDKVITAVAHVFKNCLNGSLNGRGMAARIGGEEFALLLPDTSAAGGAELAERIRAAVERGRLRRGVGEESIGTVTVSIGLASHRDGEEFEALLTRADHALYRSKQAGRNRVSIDTSEISPGGREDRTPTAG